MGCNVNKHYRDVWYVSADGLRLYARDYSPVIGRRANERQAQSRVTLLCMHGLTRNSADFEGLCEALRRDYRLVVPDQRGRGRSAYDPDSSHYQPAQYAADMLGLIEQLQLEQVVLIGTSMGGLMAMILNALKPGFFKAVVLNDIGPEVNPAGLERIKSYVGKDRAVKSWEAAAAEARRLNGAAFPDYTDADWMRFARRTFGLDSSGKLLRLYDAAIARPIASDAGSAVPPDLWPLFAQLAAQPLLLVRGELSDILTAATVAKMQSLVPDMQYLEVPRVGHAPMLDEPQAIAALQIFLNELSSSELE
ncbi:alpha/beta hydrolase [Pseudomaricurvus alcaniphilus]|nr:alpha/beta hydrolase [Pseudomaricurvus alcaniphilus]